MAKTLTKTELEIMQYLWSIDQEVTAGDIRGHFSDRNWSKQTISTFLKHLVKRGYLNVIKTPTSKYYYAVAITEEEHNILPAKEIIEEFFSGSLSSFICAFSKPEELSDEEVQRLENLITQLKNEHK